MMTKQFTPQHIAEERAHLSNAIDALRTVSQELGAILKQDEAAGEVYAIEVLRGWIADARGLSDVLDMAYGETFWLDGIERETVEPETAESEARP